MVELLTSSGQIEVLPLPSASGWEVGSLRVEAVGRDRWALMTSDGQRSIGHAIRVGDAVWVHLNGTVHRLDVVEPGAKGAEADAGCTAPMPGSVLDVLVSAGEEVQAGAPLVVMEAMKMEHRVVAPHDGTVRQVLVKEGDRVDVGQTLVELEHPES